MQNGIKRILNCTTYFCENWNFYYCTINIMTSTTELPKKRGRKKKMVDESVLASAVQQLNIHIPQIKTTPTLGLKPKKKTNSKLHTTKVIESLSCTIEPPKPKTNVILYLKCTLKDVEEYAQQQSIRADNFMYNPSVPDEVQPFEQDSHHGYHLYHSEKEKAPSMIHAKMKAMVLQQPVTDTVSQRLMREEHETFSKEMLKEKLKTLKLDFYKPDTEKCDGIKSSCFWCTYPYDNDTCYILRYSTKGEFCGHGSFCSPECSVAYLFNNCKWDESAKMESYQLINYYYGKEYEYTRSIKPANDPHYFLDKFYGNLNIQEFRLLSKSQHMLLCVDKPVTRVLPEIHEDSESILYNSTPSIQKKGNYKVKKQSEKPVGPSRNTILRENFGVSN